MMRSLLSLLLLFVHVHICRPVAATDEIKEPKAVSDSGSATDKKLAEVDFARDIRPLLSDHCFACHGPDEGQRQADLRIDQLESMLEDRGGYQVLAPGNPDNSELMRRVTSEDAYEVMPPPETGKPLDARQKELLRKWIEAGAEWQQHWAYRKPRQVAPPVIDDQDQLGENWIDAFVAQRHRDVGGRFSERADTITLIRRLSFDLTGLPPQPATVRRVASDDRPDALARYTDELLASPAFGERMAIYWLDLVRYADTVGYHGDQDHNISPYRDYVIHAFNDDLPFDAFTIEQLAGDLLEDPSEEQIVATGYNRLLQTSHEGGVQPKEYLAIYQADRVRNLSAVWMGATVGCAQCHDHKYDPYTAKDFYSLAAFFADVDETQHFKVGTNSLPTRRPPERKVLSRGQRLLLARYEAELAAVKAALNDLATGSSERDQLQERRAGLEEQIAALKDSARTTMITVSTEPRVVRYLPRGNWLDDSGDVMQPAIPEFLGTLAVADRPTRLDLAKWLTNPQEGVGLLTSRVFVNRLWMLFFGRGLSKSVEDFGGQGEPPSHPQLLDQLAIEFVRSGWDVKHLVRLITGSRTYRQSSLESDWHRESDPENRWLTRQNRFRVSAEMVRDTTLACSGLLVRRVGGASVKPYQPAGYYQHLNFPTRRYQASASEGQWRRGLYVHWQRQFLHPMLRAFDAPTREECTAQRPQSNTPLAALVWLNDPSFVEAARALAYRVLQQPTETEDGQAADRQRIVALFEISTSRQPDRVELDAMEELLVAAREHYQAGRTDVEEFLAIGMLELPEEVDAPELAAWTTAARAVLNLNETYTRN